MARSFDLVTFDCYGTLIDWEEGITRAFLAAARNDGVELAPAAVMEAYASVEPAVERESFRLYRDVLTETALRVAALLGWRLERDRAAFLPDSLPGWTPFPDTNAALEKLREGGYRLGILSNVDDALLEATRRHFTVPFDLIVTAQQVRSYKPGPAHFETARKLVGASTWLHAAQSNFHDIVPANALGIATAWVNRRGEHALPGGIPSFAEVPDLAGLAARL